MSLNYSLKPADARLLRYFVLIIIQLTVFSANKPRDRYTINPERTSQFQRALTHFHTWSHTRWCVAALFCFFLSLCDCDTHICSHVRRQAFVIDCKRKTTNRLVAIQRFLGLRLSDSNDPLEEHVTSNMAAPSRPAEKNGVGLGRWRWCQRVSGRFWRPPSSC